MSDERDGADAAARRRRQRGHRRRSDGRGDRVAAASHRQAVPARAAEAEDASRRAGRGSTSRAKTLDVERHPGQEGQEAKKAKKTPKSRAVRNPFVFVYNYLKQVVAELRKVIWPNRKQMVTYTVGGAGRSWPSWWR